MLKTLSAALLFVAVAAAQTPPATAPSAPACLSGPVTQGTVTLSCSAIDNTSQAPSDSPALIANSYLFQVKVASSDPSVVGVLVSLTVTPGVNPSYQRAVALAPTAGIYSYTFVLGAAVTISTPTAATIGAPTVTGIQIQELKPSTSQSF